MKTTFSERFPTEFDSLVQERGDELLIEAVANERLLQRLTMVASHPEKRELVIDRVLEIVAQSYRQAATEIQDEQEEEARERSAEMYSEGA